MVLFVICFSVGVLVTKALSLTFDDILFIPTSLGILVYVLSMAAGVKLFRKNTPAWWIVNLFHFMFAGDSIFQLYIFVPLIVGYIYDLYDFE